MWTKRNAVVKPILGILRDKVFVKAAWAQISSTFGMFKFPYCDNFEAIVRYGWVDSGIEANKRTQWSYGLDYYLTDALVVKLSFDQNRGRLNKDDRVTLQWAYGY